MKNIRIVQYCFLLLVIVSCNNSFAQNPENWTSEQLVKPVDLAAALKTNKDLPVIFSVGPGAVIPNSIDIGMVKTGRT